MDIFHWIGIVVTVLSGSVAAIAIKSAYDSIQREKGKRAARDEEFDRWRPEVDGDRKEFRADINTVKVLLEERTGGSHAKK